MAKETKKTAAPVAATVENVETLVTDKNRANDLTLGQKALAELKEENDERVKNELKRRIKKAEYDQLRTLVELKHERSIAEIKKEKLKNKNYLLNNLIGFTAEGNEQHDGAKYKAGEEIAPSLTPSQYDEECRKLANEIDKKVNDANQKRDKLFRELRDTYGMWYEWDWDRY
jgi:hypothetical protein